MYFLDTNTCIYFLNGASENIKQKILGTAPIQIKIPVIVKAELLLGAYKSLQKASNLAKLEAFLQPFEIVAFADTMTTTYAQIRSSSEITGQPIGPNDLFIAAIVQFHNAILVTNNTTEFERVAGLKLENWY